MDPDPETPQNPLFNPPPLDMDVFMPLLLPCRRRIAFIKSVELFRAGVNEC